ncbi:hypothetical protein TNCV_3058051 [Trichonephila clavipes]|nr:hypothetical protein TNCV_3058051 [Trichonephila clavipes]
MRVKRRRQHFLTEGIGKERLRHFHSKIYPIQAVSLPLVKRSTLSFPPFSFGKKRREEQVTDGKRNTAGGNNNRLKYKRDIGKFLEKREFPKRLTQQATPETSKPQGKK